jgi:hypothetical protein
MESYSEDEHDLNPYASYYPFPPTYHVAPAASSALNPTYSCLSSSPDQPFQHDNNASHREPSRIWSEDQGLVSTGGPSGSAVPLPAPRAGEKRRKRRQVLSSAAPLQLLHLGLSDLAFPSTPLTSVGHKKLSCASAFLRREDATLSGPQADCPLSFYLHTVVEKLYQMLGDPSMHAASLSLTSLRLHESPRYERD